MPIDGIDFINIHEKMSHVRHSQLYRVLSRCQRHPHDFGGNLLIISDIYWPIDIINFPFLIRIQYLFSVLAFIFLSILKFNW